MGDSSSDVPDSGNGAGMPVNHETAVLDFPAVLFGRYRVRSQLGRGGMGVVLLAMDEELDQFVAVKLIPDLVVRDTEAIADLKKEVLRGMALLHPNIVRTHHFERDASAAAIIMEYVEGQSLAELKAQQPDGCFDAEDILPWLEQLCPVLDYAHAEAKIAHRDLKPRNIMLTPSGRVKVADFGISSQLTDSLTRLSASGKFSGTPPYMSPQQAMGERPSHLDDVYSLGATIYELLTSKPPFFRGHILSQVIDATPPAMTARLRELDLAQRRALPLAWERVIAQSLSKEPTERPQSAGALLARLKGEREPQSPVGSETGAEAMGSAKVSTERAGFSYRPKVTPPESSIPAKLSPPAAPESPESPPVSPGADPGQRRGNPRRALALGIVILTIVAAAFGWMHQKKPRVAPEMATPPAAIAEETPVSANLIRPLHGASGVSPGPTPNSPAQPAAASASSLAHLVATTSPSEATISLDGRSAVHGSVDYRDLAVGPHRLVVTAAGYITREIDFQATPDGVIDLGTIQLDRESPQAGAVKDRRFAGTWSGVRRSSMTMKLGIALAGGIARAQEGTTTQPISIEISDDLSAVYWHQGSGTTDWKNAVYQNAPGQLDVAQDKANRQKIEPEVKVLGPFKPTMNGEALTFTISDPSQAPDTESRTVELTLSANGMFFAKCRYHHLVRFSVSGVAGTLEEDGIFPVSKSGGSKPGPTTWITPVPMDVEVHEIDATDRTFVHHYQDGRLVTFVVTDNTEIKNGDAPASFADIKVGDWVSGTEIKRSDAEFEVLKITRFGPRNGIAAAPMGTPVPATPATPPPSVPMADQLRAFCDKVQRDEQSQDFNRIMPNYDSKVDYIGMGRVGQATIRADKAKYFQRWPQTTYQLKTPPEMLESHADRWKVRFQIDFMAANTTGERVTGVAEQTLDIAMKNGALKIVGEKGQVLSREKGTLPPGTEPTAGVPPPQVQGKQFDGHGTVYKIPDLKNLVGKPLKNAWLYGDFDWQSFRGNVAVFVTANIVGAVGKGSTIVSVETPAPVILRQETTNNRQQYYNQTGIWPEVIMRITPNDPLELIGVSRDAQGHLVVRTRSTKPIQL